MCTEVQTGCSFAVETCFVVMQFQGRCDRYHGLLRDIPDRSHRRYQARRSRSLPSSLRSRYPSRTTRLHLMTSPHRVTSPYQNMSSLDRRSPRNAPHSTLSGEIGIDCPGDPLDALNMIASTPPPPLFSDSYPSLSARGMSPEHYDVSSYQDAPSPSYSYSAPSTLRRGGSPSSPCRRGAPASSFSRNVPPSPHKEVTFRQSRSQHSDQPQFQERRRDLSQFLDDRRPRSPSHSPREVRSPQPPQRGTPHYSRSPSTDTTPHYSRYPSTDTTPHCSRSTPPSYPASPRHQVQNHHPRSSSRPPDEEMVSTAGSQPPPSARDVGRARSNLMHVHVSRDSAAAREPSNRVSRDLNSEIVDVRQKLRPVRRPAVKSQTSEPYATETVELKPVICQSRDSRMTSRDSMMTSRDSMMTSPCYESPRNHLLTKPRSPTPSYTTQNWGQPPCKFKADLFSIILVSHTYRTPHP